MIKCKLKNQNKLNICSIKKIKDNQLNHKNQLKNEERKDQLLKKEKEVKNLLLVNILNMICNLHLNHNIQFQEEVLQKVMQC